MIYIGIDTGTFTGVAVWDSTSKQLVALSTMKIHQALVYVEKARVMFGSVKVIFEDARQRKYLPRERSLSEAKGKLMGAGSVKRDAAIWEDFCRDRKIPFEAVPPRKGMTKWSEDYFRSITGWNRKTSEHARDAAVLVFGK